MSPAHSQFDEQRLAAIIRLDRESNRHTKDPTVQSPLIALHPQSDHLLKQTQPSKSWHDSLFSELADAERIVGIKPTDHHEKTPSVYWHRRYEVAFNAEWRRLLAELPDFWRVLLELSVSAVESFGRLLGIEMIARLTAGKNKTQINDLLSPLEEETRMEVFARSQAIDPDELPLSVTAAWEQLYRKGMKRRIGQKLVRWFAMSLLSSLMQIRLPKTQRTMATRHGRSDLFTVLNRPSKTLVPTQHADFIESFALELLGELQPSSGSSKE